MRVSHSFQAKRTSQSSIPPLLFWRTGSGSPNSIDEGRRNFPQSCPSAAVVLTGPDQVLIRKVYYPGRAWSATLKAGFGVLTGRNPADQTKIPCLSRVLGVWAHLESRCPMESKGAVFPSAAEALSCSLFYHQLQYLAHWREPAAVATAASREACFESSRRARPRSCCSAVCPMSVSVLPGGGLS